MASGLARRHIRALPELGRVRIPGSSGSRFVPLTQVDTVDASTVASTIAPTKGVAGENIRPTVHESDTETMPSVGGSPEDSEDDGHSDEICSTPFWEKWMQVSKRSWPVQPHAQHSQVLILSILMEVFTKRARVLKSPPAFLKGAFRSCMRMALQRAERAQQLANLGELSSARLALEGSALAPGNLATLRSLTNARRPARQREPMPQSVTDHLATGVFSSIDSEGFCEI